MWKDLYKWRTNSYWLHNSEGYLAQADISKRDIYLYLPYFLSIGNTHIRMDRQRILVQTTLAKIGIDICGASSSKLGPLIQAVQESLQPDGIYLYLLSGYGEFIAHGKYPQVVGNGPIFSPSNALVISQYIPGVSPYLLQQAFINVLAESLSIGRIISYPWIGNTRKDSYAIRILIGNQVYILGS